MLVGTVAAISSILVLGQYYVGAANTGEVGVFHGVRGEFLGLPLHTWAEGSCRDGAHGCEAVFLRDLQPYARSNVHRGMISNSGLEGAREIIGRLRTNDLLPLCPRAGTGNLPVEASPLPSPTTEAPAGGNATDTAGAPTTTGTPLPDKPSEPGVDCRTVS